MKINKANNDRLKAALTDRDLLIEDTILYALNNCDIDDTLLSQIHKYLNLTLFQKDLLFLTTKYPVVEIASMYDVSTTHIYNTIKKINKLLK